MSEVGDHPRLDEQIVRSRLYAFEANRAFFIQMWLQNPQLAAQAGERVVRLLSPLPADAVAGAAGSCLPS